MIALHSRRSSMNPRAEIADGKGAISGVPSLAERISKSDAVLLNNILNGYQSPGATMAMPPRGGNANVTEQDIKEVLSYIRKIYGQWTKLFFIY